MSTTPEPGASLTARQRASVAADKLIEDFESIIHRPDAIRSLLAIAYLEGEHAGTEATTRLLRGELSEL